MWFGAETLDASKGYLKKNPHDARPVHLIFTMIKWIWTSRLSIKNSLPLFDTSKCGASQHVTEVPHFLVGKGG